MSGQEERQRHIRRVPFSDVAPSPEFGVYVYANELRAEKIIYKVKFLSFLYRS